MTTFEEAIKSGTGRVEFVFHVRGMPWAATTSKDFADYLVGDAISRQAMFGADTYNGGANYFADDVDIWPILETPGLQTIANEDAMSALSGGNWTAKIADVPPGAPAWPHSARTTIVGLEGLHAIANPRIDRSILSARIGSAFPKGEDILTLIDDAGGLLGTAADAASDASPLVLWVGGECMAAVDGSSSGTEGTAKVEYRGILGSVEQFHGPNKMLTSAPSLRVANAPLGGIQNRPYALFAFVYVDEGRSSTAIGPAMVRHGKVSSNISYSSGMWSVECLPWWSWLDTELTVPAVSAPMAKYVLSRYGNDEDMSAQLFQINRFKDRNPAHVIFREYDSTTDTVSPLMEAWLCDEWESVTYDSIEDLEIDLCVAMTTESAANGFSWTYSRTNAGPGVSTLVDGDMVRIGGDLAVLLQWGDWIRDLDQYWPDLDTYPKLFYDANFLTAEMEFNALMVPQGFRAPHLPFKNFWISGQGYWDEVTTDVWTVARQMCHSWNAKIRWRSPDLDYDWQPGMYLDKHSFANMTAAGQRKKPSYILQWGWSWITLPPWTGSAGGYYARVAAFPVPVDPDSGEARIWVRQDYDIQTITADSKITVGTDDPDNPILSFDGSGIGELLGIEPPSFAGFTSLGEATVDSVGAGGDATNYIVVKASTSLFNGSEIIKGLDNGQFDSSNRKYIVGQTLFGYNQDDPAPFVVPDHWPISQSFNLSGESLSEVFLAILGHPGAGPTVAEAIQADHIPDYTTIDWDMLDSMTHGPTETTFDLRYQGSVNLWKLLNEELKFYNLTPTWEWDSDAAQYRMRFKRVSLINASLASATGRTIDDSIVAVNTSITAEHASAWQINKLSVSLNWNPKSEEYEFVFPVSERSGFAPAGGRAVQLDIEPKITRIKNLANSATAQTEIAAYLGGHLENMMDPRPAAAFDATVADMLLFGVGNDARLTAPDIRDPFTGAIGVTEWPCAVSSIGVDFSKSTVKYKAVMAARPVYGWAPTCLITESSVDEETGHVLVSDIAGSGQEFCGQAEGSTPGWYDHWWFGDFVYNTTMAAPQLESSDKFLVTLTERGTKAPIRITGVIVEYVNPHDYATADAGDETFLELDLDSATYDPPGSEYDSEKEWYVTHDDYTAALYDPQRSWIFIADSSQQIEHPDTGHETGREWE
jgi:hypothetical protein